jgi:PAS domain S-box-containing protein
MTRDPIPRNALLLQIHDLSLRLEEAQEALRAIRQGEVDALVVKHGADERIYTLKDADYVYRSFIEHMSEGALVVGTGHTILYSNQRFADLVQVALEKVIGAGMDEFIAADDRPGFVRLLEQGRRGHARGELGLAAGGETPLRVLVSVSPAPQEEIADAGLVLVTDVTALRQAQEDLRQAHDELEAKVAERTSELRRANAALAEADRRKDEFLAMLAHELRNPLAPIRNASRVLRLKGPRIPEFQAPLGMIERQSQHLARLVDDLLDVSRLTRGKITLRKQPVDLAALVAQVVENHGPAAKQHRHAVTLNLPPRPLRVEGDEVRLTQIFSNLLNNAIKYTPAGGRIQVAAEEAGGEVRVSVRDNGIGMAAGVLPLIFDLFVQVNQGLDRTYGGLGIGLSLVRRLLEMHGGRIEAHSEGLGRGSEFILHLPLLPAAGGREPGPAAASPEASDGALRVLVVDDNRDAAESLAELLALEGFETRLAYDGAATLAACRDLRPDVILLDIGLPGMDGYEIARQLRREYGRNHLVLVAMTGYGQAHYREWAVAAGFDHYLVKPVGAEALLELLASLTRGPLRP